MKNLLFNELQKSTDLDLFISNFMSVKEQVGNGVGAGKLFERLFTQFINKTTKLSAIHMNLMNSEFIWDIIISDNKSLITNKSEIINIIKSNTESDAEKLITQLIGDNWIAISLKTYKEDACQITTDYSYRTWLENNIGEQNSQNTTSITNFFNLLNKHDSNRYIIIALNTYAKTKIYTFRELIFSKIFDSIDYKKNKKLSQYNLILNSKPCFKILYGKNQANAFQRGIWTYNENGVNYFPIITKSTFVDNDYFERVIEATII